MLCMFFEEPRMFWYSTAGPAESAWSYGVHLSAIWENIALIQWTTNPLPSGCATGSSLYPFKRWFVIETIETKGFLQFEIIINVLVSSFRFIWIPMSLPALRFGTLVQKFQRNIMFIPSQSWDIVKMLCPWARHFTLKCFTWLRWKWVPGRTAMAMCTISSMRRNGCRTVCSPWS